MGRWAGGQGPELAAPMLVPASCVTAFIITCISHAARHKDEGRSRSVRKASMGSCRKGKGGKTILPLLRFCSFVPLFSCFSLPFPFRFPFQVWLWGLTLLVVGRQFNTKNNSSRISDKEEEAALTLFEQGRLLLVGAKRAHAL